MSSPALSPLPAAAAAAIDGQNGAIVVFAGSGISLFRPTSFPSWWSFIKLVIAAVGEASGSAAGVEAAATIAASLDSGKLPPYRVTDVLARRLGASYLAVMEAFLGAEPNPIHCELAGALLQGRVRACITTNFDQALETALTAQGGDAVSLTGDWDVDRDALDAQWQRHRDAGASHSRGAAAATAPTRPIVVVPTFRAFESVGRVATLLGQESHAWVFKVHGDAATPLSCIDTEFQRSQGLPSHVSEVLTGLLHQAAFLFLGFGGGDLARDIDYLRLRSDGDQARVFWLLRDGEAEPAAVFERMRRSLGERFTVLRGSLAGDIEPGGGAVIRSRIMAWGKAHVGPLWAAIVLNDLGAAAGMPLSLVRPVLVQAICDASTGAGADAGTSAAETAPVASPSGSNLCVAKPLGLTADAAQALAHRCGTDANALFVALQRLSAGSSLAFELGAAVHRQLAVAAPCAGAVETLQRLSTQIAASADASSDAHFEAGSSVDASLAVVAVHSAAAAVVAQRRHFADSRALPDAWMPLAALGAALDAAAQTPAARVVWSMAAAVAELAGNSHVATQLEDAAASAAASAAAAVAADADAADKGDSGAQGRSDCILGADGRQSGAGAVAGILSLRTVSSSATATTSTTVGALGAGSTGSIIFDSVSSIPPPMPPPSPSDTVVYLTAFDNVGAFGQQGVPAAAMLRAHLHRAMLVGERIAVGVHFLLNCRPFLCEVLLRSGGSSSTGSGSDGGASADGSAGIQLEEAYLHFLCPVMPVRQVVDRGAAGGGKVTVELQAEPHPLLACRRECQLGNPTFLTERIDEALIAAVDRFYTASPERRALIRWYDVSAVGGTYAAWLHALASDADAAAPAFGHPAERSAAAAALPPTAAFVEACLGKFSVCSGGAGASEAAACAEAVAAAKPAASASTVSPANPVAALSVTHIPATPPPGTGYLTRSLMYKWADLFRYPTTPADFAKGCGPQMAALNAHGPGTKAEIQLRAAAAAVLDASRDGLSDCTAAPSASSDSCGSVQPLSELLLRVRGALVERPWLYGGVLRLLSDAPYITALPLSPALSLSLIVDGEREQSVVALSRLALGLVAAREAGAAAAAAADRSRSASASGSALGTCAAPASGTSSGATAAGSHGSGGSVRVLDPLSVTSDLRVTELARLPVSEVIALRGHPAAVAFRAAVARLRRRAGRRILGAGAGGHGPLGSQSVTRLPSAGGRDRGGSSDVLAAPAGLTPPATPLLSRAHSGSGGVSACGGFAGADSEEALAAAALAAAEAFCALLRTRLVPVDQQALPQLSLEALPAADVAVHRRAAALRASLRAPGMATHSCTDSSSTDADSSNGAAPAATANGLACSPHLPPAVWQALRAGVTVCKGDPIPPTFSIPRIAFPALVPVVRAAAALPGSAAAAAATVSRQLSGHSRHAEAPASRSTEIAAACGAPPLLVEVAAAESFPASSSSFVGGASAGATPSAATAGPGIGQQSAAVTAGAVTTVVASTNAACLSTDTGLVAAETDAEGEGAHPVRCLEPITAYSEPSNKWIALRFDRVRFPSGAVGRHNVVVEFGARAGRPGVCILPITPDRHILFLKQYRYPVREWSWEIPRGGPELGRSPLQQAIAELEEETGYTVQYRSGEAVTLAAGVTAASGAAVIDSTAQLAVELTAADLPAGARPRMLQLAAGAAAADFGPRSATEGVSAGSSSNESPRAGSTEGGVGLLWPNTGISDTVCAFFAAVDVVPLPSGSRREATEAIERVQPVPVEDCYEMVRSGAIRDQFTIAALGLGILHGLLPPPGDALL